jgi:hypothetical protein
MPKGECIDIVATKADPTRNFYRVRFRNPKRFRDGRYTTPKWASRAAETIGTRYYGVSGCKITMAKPKDGSWMIQSILVPKAESVDERRALTIANHIQDRIEREGEWAKKVCRDNENQRFVGVDKRRQHIIRDSRGRFAPHAAESYQVREGFDTCETCGDSPLFVSTRIAGGTYCMDCANRVWRAESFNAKGIDTFTDPFDELRGNGLKNTAMAIGSVVVGFILGKRYGGDV